jgi:hypothetical protein
MPIHSPLGTTISREALEVALAGLRKYQAEIAAHIADLEAALDPPVRRGRPRLNLDPKLVNPNASYKQGWPDEAPTLTHQRYGKSIRRVWSNDPERKYAHNQDGSIRLKSDGTPWLNTQKTSPAQLAALVKARAARTYQRRSAPIKGSAVKQEYYPNGEAKYLTNPDGSVRLTRLGKPWKRIPQAVLEAAAVKSHVARGFKPASALKRAKALRAQAGVAKPHAPLDPRNEDIQ